MKAIIIRGASNSGKSTTIREVCKRLKPTKIHQLQVDKDNLKNSQLIIEKVNNIFNNTFIIEVKGKYVLVVAGANTEQNIKISILIKVCVEIKIDISFFLVSIRSFEKKEDFNTLDELKKVSEIIKHQKIQKITGDDFDKSDEWNNRINQIVETIEANI